jgi:hypothetical protein
MNVRPRQTNYSEQKKQLEQMNFTTTLRKVLGRKLKPRHAGLYHGPGSLETLSSDIFADVRNSDVGQRVSAIVALPGELPGVCHRWLYHYGIRKEYSRAAYQRSKEWIRNICTTEWTALLEWAHQSQCVTYYDAFLRVFEERFNTTETTYQILQLATGTQELKRWELFVEGRAFRYVQDLEARIRSGARYEDISATTSYGYQLPKKFDYLIWQEFSEYWCRSLAIALAFDLVTSDAEEPPYDRYFEMRVPSGTIQRVIDDSMRLAQDLKKRSVDLELKEVNKLVQQQSSNPC